MRFTTAFLAITASLAVASPESNGTMAPSIVNVNVNVNGPNCTDCDNIYHKCMSSIWCWFNPAGCQISCKRETCEWNRICVLPLAALGFDGYGRDHFLFGASVDPRLPKFNRIVRISELPYEPIMLLHISLCEIYDGIYGGAEYNA
ncbi:hypothetical protein GQ44DRAFT_803700 [Phaeosphaeriaceae sp. PMI808]|nr:hypothetical protein GQ44DRAFT_803700 [Phaeosphaeriaceae sp. PMI808]